MGSFKDDESIHSMQSIQSDSQASNAPGEKIFVAVRLRPLNDKETARNDEAVWECLDNSTIIYKHGSPEKPMSPTAHTFDKAFASECSTKQVYEEGPKNVALSVLSGINASIFAYGQTSSGKTYTMRGITEYTMADIFDYIHEHNEREFVLKFSAMEIYNESVRDLLSFDSTPLRLLDDPEVNIVLSGSSIFVRWPQVSKTSHVCQRGTVVERLTEVTLTGWSHLKELLAVCEAERQIGETSLNETSSRSHQIIRLTVESSPCEFLGADSPSTLSASVSLIDLAGSERASQTSSAGSRLKEGSHINRSLLTLGTVIRKLSKGKNGHVPFRDSKLTRILHNSLGGNARSAILCTMSPAHSHVEQSRNTLLFASCAKKVSTNAQVNAVMSEKALVKQLQKELARLENELRSVASVSATEDSASLLREKERLIEKMDTEIRELTQQRDLAQSRIKEMLQSRSGNQVSETLIEADQISDSHEKRTLHYENSISDSSEVIDPPHLDGTLSDPYYSERPCRHDSLNSVSQLPDNAEDLFLSDGSPNEFLNKYFGPDLSRGWDDIAQKSYDNSEENCKEVRCVEIINNRDNNLEISGISSPQKGDTDYTCENPNPNNQDMKTTTDDISVGSKPTESSDNDTPGFENVNLVKSSSGEEVDMTMSALPLSKKSENDDVPLYECEVGLNVKPEDPMLEFCNEKSPTKHSSEGSQFLDEKEKDTVTRCDIDNMSFPNDTTENKDDCNHNYEVKYGDNMVQDAETNKYELLEKVSNGSEKVFSPESQSSDWKLEFERQRKQIIQLWDACYTPLIHRTYFFLLFQGDPSDSVYMEVEFRRLSFLMQTTFHGTSVRALNRERDMLAKRIIKKYSAKERAALYEKWGIKLNSKKRRKQLSCLLWNDTEDMDHIKESAALVANLVGQPSQAPKEMFGLSFAPQHGRKI